MKNHNAQIKRILRNFNFEQCRKAMCALDWTWLDADQSPSIEEMKKTATKLLKGVAEANQYGHTHATGGFEARLDFNGDLHLKFVVEEWDGSDYTNGADDESED